MDQDIVMTIIAKALDFLYDNDQYLISNGERYYVSERSIAHKLGCYLSQLIQEYDIDCEFSRDLDAIKQMGCA